jgi:deoxyribonuclease-4
MKFVGAHVSVAGGVENAPIRADAIKAKAFAMFVKNQRQWSAKPLTDKNIELFKQNCKLKGLKSKYILPHASYLINLGSKDKTKLEKSKTALIDEINRCNQLGLKYLNIHPGAHLNQSSESECLDIISDNINEVLLTTSGVSIILENTAGEGSNVGYRFEHLRHIINKVEDKSRIGVCIDTCHLFASGYDIRVKSAYDKTFLEFDAVVGFEWLRGMHLNDAKSEFASRVDRHHSIGKGNIGIDAFGFIMNDDRIDDIPMILETIDSSIWDKEIELLYSLIED